MMNTEELTAHIKNYLENDKTRSAIMLTGTWGCGKSYYIQNILTNELNKCNHDVAIVSLYGLKTIAELNKNIYLELRAKKTLKKLASKKKNKETKKRNKLFNWIRKHGKEAARGTALIGKTIIKGVAGFFNVPTEFSDKDLEKLYASINLNGKLIVLEDLERSGIDIIEIMGYVNNLVEQDGAKVLLVANEKEIIKYKKLEQRSTDNKNNMSTISVPTETTEKYLREKEKTVGDTIIFQADLYNSISSIFKGFNNRYLNILLKEKTEKRIPLIINDIATIMYELNCYNLRALLYSCQKTIEMLQKTGKTIASSYVHFLLCSNTAFALRLSQNGNLTWTDDIKSPTELGSHLFPLYKCCYNYIKLQDFEKTQFKKDETDFKQQKDFKIKQKNLQNALKILYDFYISTDTEVTSAVNIIYNYLKKDENYFDLKHYSKLASYLIAVRECINDETIIDKCKAEILKKLQNVDNSNATAYNLIHSNGIELWTEDQKNEYSDFCQAMLDAVNAHSSALLKKISSPEDIQFLAKSIYNNMGKYIRTRQFAAQLDMCAILNVLPNCSASIIDELRGAFISLYRSVNAKDLLAGDEPALTLLKKGIATLIASGNINDKVEILQLKWFVRNLEDIITRLI